MPRSGIGLDELLGGDSTGPSAGATVSERWEKRSAESRATVAGNYDAPCIVARRNERDDAAGKRNEV